MGQPSEEEYANVYRKVVCGFVDRGDKKYAREYLEEVKGYISKEHYHELLIEIRR